MESIIENLKNDYKNMDNVNRKQELKLAESSIRIKLYERKKEEQRNKINKLYLLVRKLSKELTLLKEDVHFIMNI